MHRIAGGSVTFCGPFNAPSLPTVAADGKDVLIYQVDGCEHKVIAGTFDRLVKQLAGEEKPGECAGGKYIMHVCLGWCVRIVVC